MKTLIVIVLIILFIIVFYLVIKHNLKHKTETITAFTGGLGSGKSLNSVELSLKLYRKKMRQFKRKNRLIKLRNFFVFWKKPKPLLTEKPILLSNIPIRLKKKGLFSKEDVYCYVLKKEHLLLQERIPQGSVCLIDEVGAFADQFRYNEPNIKDVFGEFVRFFRHYVDGYLVVNDQCSENINLYIRRRINVVHNLCNCFVLFHLCFYFERMLNISEEIKTIDQRQVSDADTQANMNLKFRFVFNKKSYDSRCYRERYNSVPQCDYQKFNGLRTLRLLVCPSSKSHVYESKTSDEIEIL